jgi:hypothetical protein
VCSDVFIAISAAAATTAATTTAAATILATASTTACLLAYRVVAYVVLSFRVHDSHRYQHDHHHYNHCHLGCTIAIIIIKFASLRSLYHTFYCATLALLYMQSKNKSNNCNLVAFLLFNFKQSLPKPIITYNNLPPFSLCFLHCNCLQNI